MIIVRGVCLVEHFIFCNSFLYTKYFNDLFRLVREQLQEEEGGAGEAALPPL